MAQKNIVKDGDQRLESLETTLSKTELFIEENRKAIMLVVGVLVAIVLCGLAVKSFIFEPRNEKAQAAIFKAQEYFENENFATALNGDGNNVGFLDIIEDYGWTSTGNLAYYYAGISYLRTNDYENAIKYLKKYDGSDNVTTALAYGGIADASLELGLNEDAVKYYIKASKASKNDLTAPMYLFRAGQAAEIAGNFTQAVEVYKKLKTEYPMSLDARGIDRYIEKAQAAIK